MECMEVRKKLKEYAALEIKDREVMREMEEHIETCVICKRELLMWQEVVAKQRETHRLSGYLDGDFRTRVNYRLGRINSDKSLPAAARKLNAMQKMFNSVTGRLVIQIFMLLLGVLYLVLVLKKGTNFLSVIFIIIGFGTLFFLVLKKKK
jgi:hypothetical protein